MIPAWTKDNWRGKRVTVAGLGTFGGQIAAARFFLGLGAGVVVTDKKSREALEDSLLEVEALGATAVLGGHNEDDFTKADLVVASPAIPDESPYLAAARKAGVPVTHEMDIFFDLCRAPIVGITGSNGKSTTTALLAHLLSKAASGEGKRYGRCWLGGNIGRSLLLDAGDIAANDIVVLELSSFQLESLGARRVSPHGAIVTNITPNHLDRHGTFENYMEAKRNIARFQRSGDFLVLNADDEATASWHETGARVRWFGALKANSQNGVFSNGRSFVLICGKSREMALLPGGWQLKGVHNFMNLAAALAAAVELGVGLGVALAAAKDFKALPHRMEYVGTVGGVACYNDSIATTPESVEVALDSFTEPIVLIAGGYDKGVDLSPLASKAARRVKALVLIGKTAAALENAARLERADLEIVRAETFMDAITAALAASAPGDVLLMSPACASYDMFNNFQQRGDIFREEIRKLACS